MEIRLNRYHILPTENLRHLPEKEERLELRLKSQKNENEAAEQHASAEVEYVMRLNEYVYISGLASINDKKLAYTARYDTRPHSAINETVGEFVTKELIEDN